MKTKTPSLCSRAIVLLALLVIGGGGPGAAGRPQQAPASPAPSAAPAMAYEPRGGEGTTGLVSSAHPLATEAGLEILRAGGNAFDAAIAVAAALNVVEPAMSVMGGYGTILVWDARR